MVTILLYTHNTNPSVAAVAPLVPGISESTVVLLCCVVSSDVIGKSVVSSLAADEDASYNINDSIT